VRQTTGGESAGVGDIRRRRAADCHGCHGSRRLSSAETRKHFLTPWLFSDEELKQLGLPDIEYFVQDWGAFETVRSQWAAHARAKKSTRERPGRLIDASALGRALERTGIGEEEQFLRRVRDELTPAVERVRDKILEAHTEARDFITTGYPQALQQGAIDEERSRGAS
jgi:hypothetical protein